jgi:hypothetical protein
MPAALDLTGLVELVNRETGLDLVPGDAGRPLYALPGWDSMLFIRLVAALESELGRPVPVADLLTARTLAEVYAWTVPE